MLENVLENHEIEGGVAVWQASRHVDLNRAETVSLASAEPGPSEVEYVHVRLVDQVPQITTCSGANAQDRSTGRWRPPIEDLWVGEAKPLLGGVVRSLVDSALMSILNHLSRCRQ